MLDQRFSTSVHIMTALAFHKEEPLMTSEMLASSIRTNPTVVRRLVAKLVEAGLLLSYKGKSGGVKLAKDASAISLKEIYLASADKKLIYNPEKIPKKQCAVSCSMKKLMSEVVDGVEENSMKYLSSIKLSELTSKVDKD